jgi:type I restriction-modification system DNA methylase subunit
VERILPDLSDNIKCGNSLIGPDFSDGLFSGGDKKVNPFDWNAEFSDIMKKGGFDVVIGNPPYGAGFTDNEVLYLRSKYSSTDQSIDSYSLFMELAGRLLKDGGKVGEIVQSGWLSAPTTASTRLIFKKDFLPDSFVSLPYDIFGAYVDTIIFTATRKQTIKGDDAKTKVQLFVFPPKFKIHSLSDFEAHSKIAKVGEVISENRSEFLTILSSEEISIIEKIRNAPMHFSDIADIQRGVTPFQLVDSPPKNAEIAYNGNLRRYIFDLGEKKYIRYDNSLAEFKPERYFQGKRILLRELISRQFSLQASLVEGSFITNKSIQSILVNEDVSPLIVLGILNSKLLSWFFLSVNSVGRRDDFPKIVLKQTRELPFPNLSNKNAESNKLVILVDRMLELNKELPLATTPQARTQLERQIAHTDKEIDSCVYALYGLSEEEIKVVEG